MLISSWERDRESGDEREREREREKGREEKRENEPGVEERKKRKKKDFSSGRIVPRWM